MSRTTVPIAQSRIAQVERRIRIIGCAACSIDFGIGEHFEKARREDHGTFYCPNGHSNYYPQANREERLERELDAARALAKRESARRQATEYQRRAAKGQLTKAKRRIANGACPCCNRTFQDLARHMAGQHPDYAEAAS
jgi:hypothetical protein